MEITLVNTGKRYNREWIFRHFNYSFSSGNSYAITGSNGSGKSTLLQVIAGAIMHSEGEINYSSLSSGHPQPATNVIPIKNNPLHKSSTFTPPSGEIVAAVSFAAPYLDLIEEMTAKELLNFHSTFKKLIKSCTDILMEVGLQNAVNKQIRYYSSGMKQRLKLAQAFFSDTPVLLLDEPTTNLDAEGVALYQRLIENYTNSRLVIISSNDEQEYDFCNKIIKIENYKS